MRGGKRVGAGRKPGSTNRRKSEIAAERALKEATRAAREERAEAREAAAAQRHEERKQARDKRAQDNPGKFEIEILPPLEAIDCPADCEPLDFLRGLMRNPGLPLGFRQACAVAALPYAHAKPLLGAKEQRRLDAFDEEGDDDMAAALRG